MLSAVFLAVMILSLLILFPLGRWLEDWLERPRNEEEQDQDERPGQADVRLAALTALPAGTTRPGR